jgi:hypothetical protein
VLVGLGEPPAHLIVNLVGAAQPEVVDPVRPGRVLDADEARVLDSFLKGHGALDPVLANHSACKPGANLQTIRVFCA